MIWGEICSRSPAPNDLNCPRSFKFWFEFEVVTHLKIFSHNDGKMDNIRNMSSSMNKSKLSFLTSDKSPLIIRLDSANVSSTPCE